MASVGRKRGVVSGILTIVPPSSSGNYVAFFDDGVGNVWASLYARDTWASDIATVVSAVTLNAAASTFIAHDSSAKVGDWSVAWASGDDTLAVIDPSGNANYTYTATSGYKLFGCGYLAGKLYWIEWKTDAPDSTPPHDGTGLIFHFRLRSANCDLTGVATVGTHDIDAAYPTVFPPLESPTEAGFVISGSACAANISVQVHEVGTLNFDVSFTTSGSGSDSMPTGDVSGAGSFGTVPPTVGISASGTSVYALGTSMSSRANGANAAVTALWTFGEGLMAAPAGGDLSSYDGSFVRRGPLGSASSPTDAFAPGEHPTLTGMTPALMFALD